MAGKKADASAEEKLVKVSKPTEAQKPSSSSSDDSHVFGAIAYVFGIFLAAIMFIVKKDDPYVKYHAAQAIVFDLVVMVVSIIISILAFSIIAILMLLGFILLPMLLLAFASFWVVWIVLMVFSLALLLLRLFFAWKAFNGSKFRLPIISKFVDKMVAK